MFLSQVCGLGSWKRDYKLVSPINTIQHLATKPLTLLKEFREWQGGRALLRKDTSLLSVSVRRWTRRRAAGRGSFLRFQLYHLGRK